MPPAAAGTRRVVGVWQLVSESKADILLRLELSDVQIDCVSWLASRHCQTFIRVGVVARTAYHIDGAEQS